MWTYARLARTAGLAVLLGVCIVLAGVGRGQAREVEIDEKVVAEKRERLSVGDQPGHVAAHDRELRVEPPRRSPDPVVAGNALLGRELHPIGRLAHAVGAPPHDQRERAAVASGSGKRVQPALQRLVREVPRRIVLNAPVVTKDNVEEYLPLGFES